MKYGRLWIVIWLLPLLAAADTVSNAVLISWDGVGRDLLRELLAADKLPATAAVIRDGSLQEIDIKGHATSTVPGHATMLTGCLSDGHGLRSNADLRSIPAGLTVFERLEQQLGATNIHTLMVAAKARNLGGAKPDDIYFLARRGFDFFDSKDRPAPEVLEVALPEVARRAAARFFLFLHYRDPDSAGHAHGKDSVEHRDAIRACDAELARLLAWLRNENLAASTRIYITADHGFDDHGFNHTNAPHVFLATNDRGVTRGGHLPDVPTTVLARMGVDVTVLRPPLAGQVLTGAVAAVESPAR